ncbi:hypothetical protein E2562_011392 [Oryza meyeriana var. granulata]|uniref:Uncharacterized protein n=1 Tax=Oryza meyeriana var. granulata TaxID=110450 RepID=A0A6G1E960_9ORYZ|nr:hypothetical protein E2562_011392 [Oryza meyeriana var. granulata]
MAPFSPHGEPAHLTTGAVVDGHLCPTANRPAASLIPRTASRGTKASSVAVLEPVILTTGVVIDGHLCLSAKRIPVA